MMPCNSFKDLQEHCYDLSIIVGQSNCTITSDWLMIASGIDGIDFTWNKYDKFSSWYCRPAIEYDTSKTSIISDYIFNLTIFNYIWGAFESLTTNIFTKNQIKKNGKVNCVINFLINKKLPILFYEDILDEFFKYLKFIMIDDYFDLKKT